jgi:photosystem II stability/assembly factor-like uncharacterized protein
VQTRFLKSPQALLFLACSALTLISAARAASPVLPIRFEENHGQAPPDVAFLSRTPQYSVLLKQHGVAVATRDGHTVAVNFAGSRDTMPVGTNRMLAKSNYLVGADPAQWRSGIANYQRVTYRQTYAGIDLLWHGSGEQIEHDFEVAPGADPDQIRLEFSGAVLQINSTGDLMAGDLRFHKPRAFQAGREIESSYRLSGQTVSFAVGKYDRSQPLTIDPVLSFSTYLGGTLAQAIALDSAGNIYVAGATSSLDFPMTSGAFQTALAGGTCFNLFDQVPCSDISIAKFSGDGSTLLYATFLGAPSSFESTTAIAAGPSGNLYIAGTTANPGMFPKMKPLPGQTSGQSFVAELSADGSSLIYATVLPIQANSKALAVDASGAVYLTGVINTSFLGNNPGVFPTVNAFQATPNFPTVYKTSDGGSHWQSLSNGLPVGEFFSASASDPSNPQVLYVSFTGGLFKTTDGGAHWNFLKTPFAPPTAIVIDPHATQTVYVSDGAVSVWKSTDGGGTWFRPDIAPGGLSLAIDPVNTLILYSGLSQGLWKSTDGDQTWQRTSLGFNPFTGSGAVAVRQIVVDPTNPGTIYAATNNGIVKSTDGGNSFIAINNGLNGNLDSIALAMDPRNPQRLFYSTTGSAQGAGPSLGSGVFTTTDGGAHWTSNSLFGNRVLAFLFDPTVNSRIWAATDSALLISQDGGVTWGPTASFPHGGAAGLMSDPTGAVYVLSGGAFTEGFVMKLDAAGANIVYSTYLGGIGTDMPAAIAVDASGRAYIAGTTDSYDFPLAAPLQPQFGGIRDMFITVLDPTGSHLVWSTFLGGPASEVATAIAVDAAGNVHVVGVVSPADTTATNGISTTNDVFVAKIKGDGSAVIFSKRLGGSDSDVPTSVAADAAGNTFVAGVTLSNDFPLAEPLQARFAGASDAFVARFDGQNGNLQFSTYLGGVGMENFAALAVDPAGNIFVTGETGSPDFPLKNPWQSYLPNVTGAFLTKISPSLGNFSGTFSANPNPIALVAGSTLGRTTLSWNAPGSSSVKITAGGTLLAENLPASGSIDTGNTVNNDEEFSLVDMVTGQPLATLTEHTVALTCDVQPVTGTSPPLGEAGCAYSAPLSATGGTPPYHNWTVSSGTLPPGLTLNAATGVISGTPVNAGTFNFSVTAQDSTGATLPAQNVSITVYTPIPALSFIGSIPHLAAEENWTTTFTLLNKGSTPATARLSFFGDPSGTLPLPLLFPQPNTIPNTLQAASFDKTISGNASLIVQTAGPGTPPVHVGSAQLSATGAVDGFAIFHHNLTGQETVVPLETRNTSLYLLAFDNTGGSVLGVALSSVAAANISVTIRDENGAQIGGTSTIQMLANGHTSFVLPTQYPVTANIRGTILFVASTGPISVLGMRFAAPNNALTTVPALYLDGAGGGSIAHIATGNGWQTTFVLVNTFNFPAPFQLNFFADNGSPLTLPIGFPQTGVTDVASVVNQTLPANATLLIQSAGSAADPAPTVGSAQLTSNGDVAGFVIYRYSPNNQEAVVPFETRTANAYILAFDNTAGTATGVAVNSVSSQAVNVPVVIRDDAGNLLATDVLNLAANGHASFTLVTDRYPETAKISGTIEFDTPSGGQIGALAFRIPAAHTFTTLPALAK